MTALEIVVQRIQTVYALPPGEERSGSRMAYVVYQDPDGYLEIVIGSGDTLQEALVVVRAFNRGGHLSYESFFRVQADGSAVVRSSSMRVNVTCCAHSLLNAIQELKVALLGVSIT